MCTDAFGMPDDNEVETDTRSGFRNVQYKVLPGSCCYMQKF